MAPVSASLISVETRNARSVPETVYYRHDFALTIIPQSRKFLIAALFFRPSPLHSAGFIIPTNECYPYVAYRDWYSSSLSSNQLFSDYPRDFSIIMLPLRCVLGLLSCFLLPFCLANPILSPERSEELSLEQNSISNSQNSSVDGWGDCITCAAKCGLFFCTCSLACSPATPIEPWACYVRRFFLLFFSFLFFSSSSSSSPSW